MMARIANNGGKVYRKKRAWLRDLIAMLISWLAFAAIVAVLGSHHGRPLEAWKLILSLNATISILGAIARSALAFAVSAGIAQSKWNWFRTHSGPLLAFDRFEEASKGPWGSIRLLWWSRFRYPVAVGALVTILLLGLEPFIQSLISFQEQSVILVSPSTGSSSASIGMVSNFDMATFYVSGLDALQRKLFEIPNSHNLSVIASNAVVANLNYEFTAAVAMGLSPKPSSALPDFSCPSSNCTWPIHSTLAFCSRCFNASEYVQEWNVTNTRTWEEKFYLSIPELGLQTENVNSMPPEPQSIAINTTSNPGHTIFFQNYTTMLASVGMVKLLEPGNDTAANSNFSRFEAAECALFLCAQVHNISVQSGALHDDVVYVGTSRVEESYLLSWVGVRGDAEKTDAQDVLDATKAFDRYFNQSLWTPPLPNSDAFDLYPSRDDLQLVFDDDEWQEVQRRTADLELADDDVARIFNVSHASIAASASYLLEFLVTELAIDAIKQSTNLSATFDQMASYVNKWMRDRARDSTPAVGKVLGRKTFVKVEWIYLIFPGVTLLAGTLFVLFTGFDTSRRHLPTWAGSSMATIAYGPDPDSRSLLRQASVRGVDDGAKQFNARFGEDWNLRLRREG